MTLKDLKILRISLHSESTLSTQDWMVTLGKKLHLPTNFFNIPTLKKCPCLHSHFRLQVSVSADPILAVSIWR